MDFACSKIAAEKKTKWKEFVVNSSVVLRQSLKVMGSNRIKLKKIPILKGHMVNRILSSWSFHIQFL